MINFFRQQAKKRSRKVKAEKGMSAIALLPFILFVIIFLGVGIYLNYEGEDNPFYQLSPTVAILPALILSVLLTKHKINEAINQFLEGAGHLNIITMCFIFLLAGAYSQVAQTIGGVESTVNFGLQFISGFMLLPGIFLTASFIALSMGTSMGTIAAMTPIALSIAQASDLSIPLSMGALVGGAMFGDNLSMISDTTIASVQSQECEMKGKFRWNFSVAVPAMVVTVLILANLGVEGFVEDVGDYEILKVIPYALVLFLALTGMNVIAVLVIGIIVAGGVGFYLEEDFTFVVYAQAIFAGFTKMTEILLLSLMIGGLGELVKRQGGLAYLIYKISQMTRIFSKKDKSRVVGEMGICTLVSAMDACTANNTVAILISGDAAKEISHKHDITPIRSAGLLDIFSCVIQGILPYSAQILLIGSLSGVSPFSIVLNNHYCFVLGIVALISIFVGFPKGLRNNTKIK